MNITETTFAPKTYLVWRKEIEIKNITDSKMWQSAFGKVYEYIQKNKVKAVGSGTALYFRWDESTGKTELGIAAIRTSAVFDVTSGTVQLYTPSLGVVSLIRSQLPPLSREYSSLTSLMLEGPTQRIS